MRVESTIKLPYPHSKEPALTVTIKIHVGQYEDEPTAPPMAEIRMPHVTLFAWRPQDLEELVTKLAEAHQELCAAIGALEAERLEEEIGAVGA